MKDVDYPAPSKKEIHRLLDYDDAWLSRKVREVADSKSSYDEESILASSLIKRQPIKRVVEKIAYMERDSQRIDPDFTAIETLENFKEEIAKKAQISPHLIFFDKPWKDLPLKSRYRQYTQEKDGSARA